MSPAPNVNPYAPPRTDTQSDFREAVVEESRRLMRQAAGITIDEMGCSLVLPIEGNGEEVLKRIGGMARVRLALGIVLLFVGGTMALSSLTTKYKNGEFPLLNNSLFLTLAGTALISGMSMLLSNPYLIRRKATRFIGDRFAKIQPQSNGYTPMFAIVEDAETFKQVKWIPEDLAWIAFNVADRRLILEGVRFQYVIYAADVLSIGQVDGATATGVQITFRVGNLVIAVVLQRDSLRYELKRFVFGDGENPLLSPVRDTLIGSQQSK